MTLAVGEAQRAFPVRPAVPVADAPASTAGHAERDALHARFADRLIVRRELNRRLVSYQGNRTQPGLRWLRYKEGFAAGLARGFLDVADGPVLDPWLMAAKKNSRARRGNSSSRSSRNPSFACRTSRSATCSWLGPGGRGAPSSSLRAMGPLSMLPRNARPQRSSQRRYCPSLRV